MAEFHTIIHRKWRLDSTKALQRYSLHFWQVPSKEFGKDEMFI